MSPLLFLLFISEFISCMVGFLFWKKIKNSYWKWFPIYLLFICLSETFGFYASSNKLNNLSYYYFSYFEIPVEYLFMFWLYKPYFKEQKRFKHLPIVLAGIFLISFLLEIFLSIHLHIRSYSISETIGNLLMLIMVIYFLFKLINSNEIINFKENLQFWVSIGITIFYLCSFPYFGLYNLLFKKYIHLGLFYKQIVLLFAALMYLMFSIGFILYQPFDQKQINEND